MVTGENPYWQFENILELEAEYGVRSAFYFLDEQHLFDRPVRDWFSPTAWQLYSGRYDINDPSIRQIISRLESRGWEVGLHGSYESYTDRERLRSEKEVLTAVMDIEPIGIRQHYLNLDSEETWQIQRDLGFKYDTSLGSSSTVGFDGEYGVLRPFDDEFVVFPLTVMDNAVMTDGYEHALRRCEALLDEAVENGAVMTVLWHPRTFSSEDFPGYGQLYRDIIDRALDLGAWVGSPGQFYEEML